MRLSKHHRPIFAAEDELEGAPLFDDDTFGDDPGAEDTEEIEEDISEVEESDDITQDDPSIEIDNNIENHYIAECESCHGIFISAVVQSDQAVESISGTCPLCGKDTDQSLKWVIKSIEDVDD